ncbi:hypothetical protein jbd68_28 [Pseudomonas phage JBD68]|nr:hypothetical protein jbd68_28 [Pseudomonas phage JBD68]
MSCFVERLNSFPHVKAGAEPDYSAWIVRVEEVKARYPLPEAILGE